MHRLQESEFMKRLIISLITASLLSACTLAPHYRRPESPVPDSWPSDTAAGNTTGSVDASASGQPSRSGIGDPSLTADQIGWRDFFTDPRLQHLIEIALENNRNLRIAVLNVAASEAEYRVQRGALFPAISATGSGLVEKLPANATVPLSGLGGPGGSVTSSRDAALGPTGGSGGTIHYYSAGIGFTSYELDLFGRERSLTTQAFEQYLAQSETRRSTQISLVSEVATAYFAVLADRQLLRLTEDTLRSETESYNLTQAMYEADTTTLLSLRQAEGLVDSARASLAQYQRQLAQDSHALTLLLGQSIPDPPGGIDLDAEGALADLPAGLPSELLTRRPDIMAAEHDLRAANANIGAARAAFLPSIQLTGSGGTASNRLGDLFSKGTGTWSFAPTINVPLFTGGRNRANLDLAHIEKNMAVARYELTIQTAFREVSDALNARETYRDQRNSQQALAAADAEAYRLAEMRFRSGVDSYLATLDAQRSLYAAEQQLVAIREAELANQVTLYKVLGGGWAQHTAAPDRPTA
jgi:multidrug efflux system outer membrane protein